MVARIPPAEHDRDEAAATATGRFAKDYETIYDGVIGPWFLPIFAAAADLAEYDYAILLPPAAVCVERVLGRTGHGFIDEGATRKMHREFEKASIDRRHVFENGSGSPANTARAIRSAQGAGRLRYVI